MRTELPECKRCCFCLPLRYGLLTWIYLKLVGTLCIYFSLASTIYYIVSSKIRFGHHPYDNQHVISFSVTLAILTIDSVFSILFIIGGHKKNVKLLRIYFFYSFGIWILTILLFMGIILLFFISRSSKYFLYQLWIGVIDFSSSFVYVLMQTYFLLLLRSEIMKLRSNCEFRFVNNVAEAQCTLEYKGDVEKQNEPKDSENETHEKNETVDECKRFEKKRFCDQNVCLFKGSCHSQLINEEEE